MVSVARASGTGFNPTAGWAFLATPATVTVATGQIVHVTSTKVLGSAVTGGGTSLDLDICRQSLVGGSTIATSGMGGLYGVRVPQNTRQPMAVSMMFSGLPAGTYQVGLCAKSDNPASWNYNEYSYTTAIVFAAAGAGAAKTDDITPRAEPRD